MSSIQPISTFVRTRARVQEHPALPPRRGVAVVLALVAVSVATLVGLSLASSGDATLATSANLSRIATARAAAASGLDLATSMLAKEGALDAVQNGVLFDGVAINDSLVRVDLRDIETGRPATGESAAIEIIARGDHDGTVQVARAIGRAPAHDAPMHADLDCSEFALLGTDTVSLQGDAHLGVWGQSPLAALGEPVRFGTAEGATAGLSVSANATTHGCVSLLQAGFAKTSDEFDNALADKVCPIPAEIHVPDAPTPERVQGSTAAPSLMIDGLVSQNASSTGDARVPARGSATLRGAVTIDVGGNLFVERGSRLYVENAAVIVVRGNTVVDASTIEVAQGASLTLIALGDLSLGAAYLGCERSDPSEGRDATGQAAYDGGAARTVIFGAADKRVLVTDGTVIKGQIYAPDARVDLENRSAVYGRILGRDVVLHEGVAVYYDPTLDLRRGWTAPSSGVWTADGKVNAEVQEVATLDDTSLLEFAVKTGIEPEAPSIAEGAVLVASEATNAADFDERIERVSTDDIRKVRGALKARLLERVAKLKELRKQALFAPIDYSESGFVSLGFANSGKGED